MFPLMIARLSAIEVLDSRGRPTLEVEATLYDGAQGSAGVPSGASTGSREAVELRDGDAARFGGLGVRLAVANVVGPLSEAVVGRHFHSLADVDQALIDADGTHDKARLGANAIVGVSMAVTRALAHSGGLSLWEALEPNNPRLPVPHFNVINGGAHAANDLDFQEFMIAPLGAPSLAEAVRAGAEIYARLRWLMAQRGLSTGLGDEGGFAPQLSRPEEVLTLLVEAITEAGYQPGREGVAIALDPAASEFFRDGTYQVAGERLSTGELIAYYAQLVEDFPIWSIEDGLGEDDWDGWRTLTATLGDQIQLVGDDIFVTDAATIADAAGVANAALIKLNQVGTVTETLQAFRACRTAGWAAMTSHRSGETPDTFIADLAVASGFGQLKSGAPARGERVAKYNRLLRISAEQPELPYGLPLGR